MCVVGIYVSSVHIWLNLFHDFSKCKAIYFRLHFKLLLFYLILGSVRHLFSYCFWLFQQISLLHHFMLLLLNWFSVLNNILCDSRTLLNYRKIFRGSSTLFLAVGPLFAFLLISSTFQIHENSEKCALIHA